MQAEINSIWRIVKLTGFVNGDYRIIGFSPSNDDILIFMLNRLNDGQEYKSTKTKYKKIKVKRPLAVNKEIFNRAVSLGIIIWGEFILPPYLFLPEKNIPEKHIQVRDKRFSLLQEIISTPDYLSIVVPTKRSKLLSSHAKEKGVSVQHLYRLLSLYWEYGQNRNALLPAYYRSGSFGSQQSESDIKRGRPTRNVNKKISSVNMTENDKKNLIIIYEGNLPKNNKSSSNKPNVVSKLYQKFLVKFYKEEIVSAYDAGRLPRHPSYRSFLYWHNKLINYAQRVEEQTNPGNFLRNHRPLLGKATDNAPLPGSCFEIDSTPLDVYVVSEFNNSYVLGRPTVYIIIDKASRMIVGLHVSMEHASWRAARQALVNAFTSKVEYCACYGIDIDESMWPCHHIPQSLACDRGEFTGKLAGLTVPLVGKLSFMPPYRPDLKAIVESHFRVLNKALIHDLKGTTLGKNWLRSDRDPRLDARYTLTEITRLLILEIIKHNKKQHDKLPFQTSLLIKNGLTHTPINYWELHLRLHAHSLAIEHQDNIRAMLLSDIEVSMTSSGVRLNDQLVYECDRPEFRAWKTVARNKGKWKLDARYDLDNSSFIYVRFNKNEKYTRCSLVKSVDTEHHNRHIADVTYYTAAYRDELSNPVVDPTDIRLYELGEVIHQEVHDRVKKRGVSLSKKEVVTGMNQRRSDYISMARDSENGVATEFIVGSSSSDNRRTSESPVKQGVPVFGEDKIIAFMNRKREKKNEDN